MTYRKQIKKKTITFAIPLQSLRAWERFSSEKNTKISYILAEAIESYLHDQDLPEVERYYRDEKKNLIKQSFFLPIESINLLKSEAERRNVKNIELVEKAMWHYISLNGHNRT